MTTVKIANDVPAPLISLVKRIDLDKMTETEQTQRLKLLIDFVDSKKYLPVRTVSIEQTGFREVIMPHGWTQKKIDVLNRYDFSRLNSATIALVKPFIQKYVNANLPIKL